MNSFQDTNQEVRAWYAEANLSNTPGRRLLIQEGSAAGAHGSSFAIPTRVKNSSSIQNVPPETLRTAHKLSTATPLHSDAWYQLFTSRAV